MGKHFTSQRGRTQQITGTPTTSKPYPTGGYSEHRNATPLQFLRKVAVVDPHGIGKHYSPDSNPAKGPLDTTRNPTLPSFEGQLHFSEVPLKFTEPRKRPPLMLALAPKKEYETQNDY